MRFNPNSEFERVPFWGQILKGHFRIAFRLVLSRIHYRLKHGHWKEYYR